MKKTDRTQLSRLPKRGSHDVRVINAILDEALIAHVSYIYEGSPFTIPTGFVRDGDNLYIHGSVGSHFMRQLIDGREVCITVALLDGLVLARSVFDSSMNYRSVVAFSKGKEIVDLSEKLRVFQLFTEKMIPGRWADVRIPNDSELNKTILIGFPLEESSAKIREGLPFDGEDERDPAVWWGVIPMKTIFTDEEPHPEIKEGVTFPDYLKNLQNK